MKVTHIRQSSAVGGEGSGLIAYIVDVLPQSIAFGSIHVFQYARCYPFCFTKLSSAEMYYFCIFIYTVR
ncbi:hypothetical protein HHI36_011312 [Cryptolaemus montrouzieri]|uniref:Uncharacterized protein n=1 Tax=Cryptolaemus montrouzieri TaxID=559131 RepID=A0ABD2MLF5_9CUCU